MLNNPAYLKKKQIKKKQNFIPIKILILHDAEKAVVKPLYLNSASRMTNQNTCLVGNLAVCF